MGAGRATGFRTCDVGASGRGIATVVVSRHANQTNRLGGALSLLALRLTAPSSEIAAQQPTADVVLVNAHVITVDSADRIAQAIAIAGNRIIAVGTTADISRLAG